MRAFAKLGKAIRQQKGHEPLSRETVLELLVLTLIFTLINM